MELTLHDISSIEIKTIPNTSISHKGAHWIRLTLTDNRGLEHDISIWPPLNGPDTIVTQTKK